MPQWWRRDRVGEGLDPWIPRRPRDPIPDLVEYCALWAAGWYARANGVLDWHVHPDLTPRFEGLLNDLVMKYHQPLWWHVWRHHAHHGHLCFGRLAPTSLGV